MSESRTAAERLDALLAALEDSVLETDAMARDGLEYDESYEGVEAIRADIEELIRTRSERSAGPESRGAVLAPGAKARVSEAMARLGRWAGIGPRPGGSVLPRVRMAFSGAGPKSGEKDEGGEARRRKGTSEDESRRGDG